MFLRGRATPVRDADGRNMKMTASPPSVSQLFTQCGIHNILQPYKPPRPVTGIALLGFNCYEGFVRLSYVFTPQVAVAQSV
jgi:hypothetical protein